MDIGAGITFGGGVSVTPQPPPPPNWLNLMTGLTTNSNYNYSVATDGTYIYVVGTYMFQAALNPGRGVSIYKYNASGVLQWSKRIYTDYYYDDAWSVELDSSGNVYIAGCLFWGWGGYSTMTTLKYDSNGNQLWKQCLMDNSSGNYSQNGGASGGAALYAKDLVVDSSLNVYTTGPNVYQNNSELVKYNSVGTLQWQKRISFANAITITKDSSTNLYVGSQYAGYFLKCDSSGTVIWSKTVNYGGQNLYINSMNVDSSDNLYIHGYINDTISGYNKQVVMKYDSSGTVLWQRKIGYAWVGVNGYTTATGDTYLVGTSNNASSTAGVKSTTIVKYNSSGTLQFQRYIKSNVANAILSPGAIKELGTEKMVITGYCTLPTSASYNQQLTFVLPNDGTGTGTFTAAGYSWTYATSTDAEAASIINSGVGSATITSSSYNTAPSYWTNDITSTSLTVTSTTSTF